MSEKLQIDDNSFYTLSEMNSGVSRYSILLNSKVYSESHIHTHTYIFVSVCSVIIVYE
jgi:hypothetical protein